MCMDMLMWMKLIGISTWKYINSITHTYTYYTCIDDMGATASSFSSDDRGESSSGLLLEWSSSFVVQLASILSFLLQSRAGGPREVGDDLSWSSISSEDCLANESLWSGTGESEPLRCNEDVLLPRSGAGKFSGSTVWRWCVGEYE